MRTGIIYKVRNSINGKCYIGKTVKTLEARKKQHYSKFLSGKYESSLFYRSVQKYGWDAFEWEVVDTPSFDILNEREKYYIKLYGDLNIACGGDGGDTISSHPNRDNIIKKFKSRVVRTGESSPSYKHISDEDEQNILNEWYNLKVKSLKFLVDKLDLSIHLIRRTLLQNNIAIPNRIETQKKLIDAGINIPSRRLKFDRTTIDNIIHMYVDDQLGSVAIAKKVGISCGDAIIKILRLNNIRIRTKSENTIISNNRRSVDGKYKQ